MTHPVANRNAIVDLIVDKCDEGSDNAAGALVIMDSDSNTLVTHDLSNPAFGDAASGQATADTITDATVSTSGTAAKFELQDRDRDTVASGTITVSGGGGDIEAGGATLAMTAGQTSSISSLIYNGPA